MTPYQTPGLTGGVTVTENADGTWTIIANGNGFTPLAAVTDYTFLRAAELTVDAGQQCFEVESKFAEMTETVMNIAYAGPSVFHYPVARLRIRILEGVPQCEQNNAQTLIDELRPRVTDRTYYNAVRQRELEEGVGR